MASRSAKTSVICFLSFAGSCLTVIACRSATAKAESKSSESVFQFLSAPR